jgi:hypothetical protein
LQKLHKTFYALKYPAIAFFIEALKFSTENSRARAKQSSLYLSGFFETQILLFYRFN